MYGLLSYSTTNIGDEIQSVAAAQFLPSVDVLLDRDELNSVQTSAGNRTKLLLNGWHTHRPENWPPSDDIDPLIVSFHLTHEITRENASRLPPAETLLKDRSLAYLRRHAPVGARDTATRDLLLEKGVEAYFSGCLTLTLGNGSRNDPGDYVCAVDLPPPIGAVLRARTRDTIVRTTHKYDVAGFSTRMRRARQLLTLYARAKCVVTTRLHCALPCLALQTPVLLITTAPDRYRFSGLLGLVRSCAVEEFLSNADTFDMVEPSPNPASYLACRNELIRAVSRFIGGTEQDASLRPFIPDEPLDLGFEDTSAALSALRKAFGHNRNYAAISHVDFLRDIASIFVSLGELQEAKRLLEIALAERPNGGGIRKTLEEVNLRLAQPNPGS